MTFSVAACKADLCMISLLKIKSCFIREGHVLNYYVKYTNVLILKESLSQRTGSFTFSLISFVLFKSVVIIVSIHGMLMLNYMPRKF